MVSERGSLPDTNTSFAALIITLSAGHNTHLKEVPTFAEAADKRKIDAGGVQVAHAWRFIW